MMPGLQNSPATHKIPTPRAGQRLAVALRPLPVEAA